MKKTTRTARKVLSVFLSVLMILTTLTVAVPGLVLAAETTYYVRVYLNIYDGANSDGYGNAYTVVSDINSEFYGKPDDYKWYNGGLFNKSDGYTGDINMAGFTLFYDNDTKYVTYDLAADLVEATTTLGNNWTSMDELTLQNFADCENKVEKVYGFTVSSIPSSLFWINDENNAVNGETSFGFYKITVAKDEDSEEYVLWEGLSGSESYMYCYYGTITPDGIITPWDDCPGEDEESFYKEYTTSFADIWFLEPTATSVAFDFDTIDYTIPKLTADDSASKFTRSAKVYDQYGVEMDLTPTSYYITDANGNVLNNDSIYYSNGVVYIKKSLQTLYPNTTTNTFYLVADYNGITGKIKLNLTNPVYNVNYYNLNNEAVLFDSGVYGATVNPAKVVLYSQNNDSTHYANSFPEEVVITGDMDVYLIPTSEEHTLTYTNDGDTHSASCAVCGYSATGLDHVWVAGDTVASTCTDQGYTNYTCACGATKKDNYQSLKEHADVNPLDHNCDVCDTKLSDCADNNNDHNCDVCGTKLSDCADNNNDHNCDVCGAELSDCTWGDPVLTTKPTADDGEYTYTCKICGDKKYVAVAREDYSEYDEAIKKAEELLENDDLTQAAKDTIEAAIEEAEKLDQQLPADVVVDGETIIDNDSAEKIAAATGTLNNVLNDIVDGEGNISDEHKKPDTSAAEEAVEAAEELEENIELPEDVKTQIDELREELNGIIGEISKDDNATEAEYKDALKEVEDAANAILEKYEDCEKDDHKFGAEEIATYPVYNEDTKEWSQGTYTKTCEVCGYVKTVAYERANYEAYDKAVADLNTLLADEAITDEAKAEINKVLTDNAIRYDLMTPDQSIVDAAVAKFVAEYNKINDDSTGAYKKADSTAAEEAVEAAEELEESIELPEDVKADIDELREALDDILKEIAADDNATEAEYKDALKEVEDAANAILEKYATCLENGHKFGEAVVAYPVYDEETDTWSQGTYTYTCEVCQYVKVETYDRADYEAYDKAVADLNTLLADEAITDEAKAEIEQVLSDNKIADNLMTPDQDDVDAAAAALKAELEKLTENGELKDEYEKPDYTNYDAAVNAYENLKDKMTAGDKAAVEEIKAQIEAIPENGTKAQYQDQIEKAAEDIAAINAKYADCADGNHNWGAPELTKKPTADEQGEYTETCGTCGTTQITKVDLADYDEFSTVVEALENLANTENLTTEAAKAIADALAEAEKLDKNLPADATTAGGKLIEGGQDEIDNLVEQLKNVVADTNAAIADGSALEPDYTVWDAAKDAYDALDKTNVKTEIITEAEALKAEIAGKQADDTLTQATATQDEIDDATERLNEIVAGIEDGTLVKPDYSGAEEAIEDAKEVADSENISDDTEAKIEAEIAELEKQLNEIKDSDPSSTDEKVKKEIAEIEQAAKDIIDTYGECAKGNHTDVTTDNDHNCDVCGKLDVTSHNYADPQLTRPVYNEEKGEWSDGYYTSTCNCGDTSETTIARADYEDYDKAVADLNALLADATLTDAAKTEINKVLADNTILQDYVATTEEQKIVDDAAAALNVVLDKLTDDEGKLEDEYKKPDYTAWDAAEGTYDALDKTNAPVDLVTEANGLKDTINALKADDTANAADDQGAINDATARLNEIIVEINKVLTEKPDFDGYEASHDTYEELVEQYGDKIKDSVADDVAALDAIVDGVRIDETATKAEDQVTVDNAKTALDAIIDGITDGSLIKPADFTEVNKDLAEAKDKAEDNEVLDSVKVDIKEIEDRLDELKKDPATNANDQEEIDALEKELEDIIAGIDDGSLVKPYYTDTEYAIKDAEKDIDNGGHLSADDKQALNELKQDLNEIKNDPTSNYKDNQDDVDAIKNAVNEIIAKYSECAKGNHTCTEEVVAPDCENEGYTKYTCTVCGKVYTGNYTDNLGHNEVIIPAVEATCSSEGYTEGKKCTVCGKITVEPQIVSKLPHTDADEDGVCDVCGQTDLYAGCGCLCHNNNWFWHIVYLIIRIIWKVFKIHPVCACGRLHY